MTAKEVAQAIKRSPRYVRDLIHCGKLRATRFGDRGPWLVYAESVSALLGVRVSHVDQRAVRRDAELASARSGMRLRPVDADYGPEHTPGRLRG